MGETEEGGSTTSTQEDPWISVVSKKNRNSRKKCHKHNKNGVFLKHDDQVIQDLEHLSISVFTTEDVIRKMGTAKSQLETSPFFSYVKEQLTKSFKLVVDNIVVRPTKVVCYGLGNFSRNSAPPRYQLAMLSSLKEFLEPENGVEVYDPAFTKQEQQILTDHLGFHLTERNEGGMRPVQDFTLFYLPHCPHLMINNLLYANWYPDQLSRCILVCNSFSNIEITIPPRLLKEKFSYIQRGIEMCVEIEMKDSFEHDNQSFNDTAIHVFPSCKVSDANKYFKEDDRKIPEYEACDLERIHFSKR